MTFQNQANAQVPIFIDQTRFLGTAGELADLADLTDLPDPRHGTWRTTPGTLAPEVRMTVVLNKLPQMINSRRLVLDAKNFASFPNC